MPFYPSSTRPNLFQSSFTFPPLTRSSRYSITSALCSNAPIPGENVCSTGYGSSLGRGSFKFQVGQWNTVAQRIKLNTPGKADGELQVSLQFYFTITFYFCRLSRHPSRKPIWVIATPALPGYPRGLWLVWLVTRGLHSKV